MDQLIINQFSTAHEPLIGKHINSTTQLQFLTMRSKVEGVGDYNVDLYAAVTLLNNKQKSRRTGEYWNTGEHQLKINENIQRTNRGLYIHRVTKGLNKEQMNQIKQLL